MANLIRITSGVRTLAQGLFSDHTGDVHVEVHYGEDGGVKWYDIYADSPSSADFNEAPIHSLLHDNDAPGTILVKTAATTWATPA